MGAGAAFKVSLKEQSAVNCPRKHNLAAQLDDIERKEGREGGRNEEASGKAVSSSPPRPRAHTQKIRDRWWRHL